MADKKNIGLAIFSSSLILFSGAAFAEAAPAPEQQAEELSYTDLGSGEEVRSNLVSQANRTKQTTQTKQNNRAPKKVAEGQCGQSKCGSGQGSGSGATGGTDDSGDDDSGNGNGSNGKKPAQGKCGQSKCGSGQSSGSGNGKTSSNAPRRGR